MHNRMLITMIILSSCFFVGSLLLNQGKWLKEVLYRGGTGMLMIGLLNAIFSGFGLVIPVGINLLNLVVAALLGIPGIAALYGIGLWQIFC